MATKLTKREVDRLEPRGTRYDVYDAEIPLFALRVAPDGTKTFSLLYRAVGVAPKLQKANPYAVAAIRFLLLSGWRKSER